MPRYVSIMIVSTSIALATVTESNDLDRLRANSELIVVGTVTSISDGPAVTVSSPRAVISGSQQSVSVQVLRTLKGPVLATTKIGLFKPDMESGYQLVQRGQTGLFFLSRLRSDTWTSTDPQHLVLPALRAAPGGTPSVESELIQVAASAGASAVDRILAISGLRKSQGPDVINAIRSAMFSPDKSLYWQAAGTLLDRGDLAVLQGIQLTLKGVVLPADQPYMASIGSSLLGEAGNSQAVPILMDLLGSANPEIRVGAAAAIATVGGSVALTNLPRMLSDPNREVRYYAVVGLGDASGQEDRTPAYDEFIGNEAKYIAYWQPSSTCASDVTSSFRIVRSGFRLNNATRRFVQTVTLTLTAATMTGPLALAVDSLSQNASLYQPAGVTACSSPAASPYVLIPSPAVLPSGYSTSIDIEFVDPTNAGITYTPRVLAGAQGK